MQLQQKTICRSSRIEISSLQITLENIKITHLLHTLLISVYVVYDNEVLTSLLEESMVWDTLNLPIQSLVLSIDI